MTHRVGDQQGASWPVLALAMVVAGCSAQATPKAKPRADEATRAAADSGDRHAYFGDLHLHTTYSFDAWGLMGTKTTPDQAYKFARGEAVSYLGQMAKRDRPLDFMAVTDHSENMGLLNTLDDPNSALSKSALGQNIMKDPRRSFYMLKSAVDRHQPLPGPAPGEAIKSAWDREIAAANANYQPGKFTTFIGYEYSQMQQGLYNLHRNVIFKGDHAPLPFSSADSPKPEDLWTYLETNRAHGIDALAIPHNGNASNGLMYDWNNSDGRPIDQAYAQRRALNEPLTEVVQEKGQSETTPDLSASDEFANFEIWDVLLTQRDRKSQQHGGYIREALGRGLVIKRRVGANPYKMGMVGATDFHNGLTTSEENAFAGSPGGIDPHTGLPGAEDAKRRLGQIEAPSMIDDEAARTGGKPAADNPLMFSGGGLTGVWAEQNTRDAIFAALKRKETFATSGPRLRVRFFGGWTFSPAMLQQADWARQAYRVGAPMGGDLLARPSGAQAPSFILQAVKDADGANLDRIQVIKVWLDGGGYKEKVFDVSLSGGRKVDPRTGRAPAVGNTVDLKTATYKNTIGAGQLSTVWRDPEFDSAKPAVYYLRALQIPTPRWTTYLAVARNLPLPKGSPATIQERAWSSPIWYTPPAPARTAQLAGRPVKFR